MSRDKFIFKVHQNGHVERIKDCNNITILDIINGLGIAKNDIVYKPIKRNGIYAFYGNGQCDVLIFAVPERQLENDWHITENVAVHGIQPSQFSMLSIPQATL
ncbi:hypothetical protein [Candidatus Parabeggiatoa sp. HSG14]|uniref:hypothetical protein n=1 Tax=Candidatus Parabeggiatoa sp. HSG14 TaxID=3055593 RepID=UPI0025A81334|nr:hypothetical protein [Thiotrichales bacterium HSG14]